MTDEGLLGHVLAHAPEYVADIRAADESIAGDQRGRVMEEVFAEVDDDTAA